MKKKKLLQRFLALFCCFALLLSGCSQNGGTAENDNADANREQPVEEVELIPITIGEVAHSVFYAPQYVAISQGFFADEGIAIDLINLQGADKVMSALITDEIQVGLMGPEASIYVSNQDLENYVINFAQLTQRDGSFLVGREAFPDFSFDKLENAEIIGGRKGGVPEMTLEYVLKSNGLNIGVDDPAQPVNVRTDIQFAAMAGSFLSGEGDYVTLFEPTATTFEREGRGYIITAIGAHSGNIPFTAYSASKAYMNAHPEIIQKFTNAVYKGQQYVQNTDAAIIAQQLHPYFEDTTVEDLTTVVQRYKDIEAWDTNPILEKEGIEKLMDVMALAGQLDQRADYDKIVTTEFAQNAIDQVK